ncbi:MAG TPA: cyclic 2,3-diphosphoglycerate synthase [Limnochordales bacterium]|nr:cyclic 2,3-diphosphoglycerate synthase [Limnochordales bacterium]
MTELEKAARAQQPRRVVIMGAAGRDFHNFNVVYRDNPAYRVVAFTATQIPDIEGRVYPASLAGSLYPEGIPIVAEEDLPELIRREAVDEVVFAYSDVSHQYVMNRASIAMAHGADFRLLGPKSTMLKARVPVVAVGAVRTGAGKSQTTRKVAEILTQRGVRVVVVRHPMPYGDLTQQVVQRFASYEDLERHRCTIEEREEYEPHIDRGNVVYAGVDYGQILEQAQAEADVILWDGGNNDFPFYKPDLLITVADPHRPGHETTYHPGETNFRMADVIIVNKVDSAPAEQVEAVVAAARAVNPRAVVIQAASPITVDEPDVIRGKRVVVVEDGPTLTHGGMAYGAGVIAARQLGCTLVDPRPYAVGSLKKTFAQYGHLENLAPAMGYGEGQMRDLEATLNATPADAVIIGTPINLGRLLHLNKPFTRVRYELEERGDITLQQLLEEHVLRKL